MLTKSKELIKWNKEMELGIPSIDEQHKKLVDLMNEFYEELEEGKKEEAIERFLDELGNYLVYHLDYEEKFLEKIGYSDFKNHKKTHEMFKKFYKEEIERVKKGDEKAVRELIAFTLSWLYTHIMKTDKKYAKFYFEKYSKRGN